MDSSKPSSSDATVQLRVEEADDGGDTLPAVPYIETAFAETVERFAADMPYIMHGSGDVEPHRVDPAAAHFLASLTAQYMAKLVHAAADTYQMFLNVPPSDDATVPTPPLRVPPPRFETYRVKSNQQQQKEQQQHRLPPPPQPLVEQYPSAETPIIIQANGEPKKPRKKPKRKTREEYWDEPLAEPKIRKKNSENNDKADTDGQNKSDKQRKNDNGDDDDDEDDNKKPHPPLEEWVGAIGVDWHADSIRRAHMPLGLSTHNFIFPICHDVYAYGRVRHVQAAKRGSVDPALWQNDHFMQDIIQEEKLTRFKVAPKSSKAEAKDAGAEDAPPEVVDPPAWPDMANLLFPGFQPDLTLGDTLKNR